MEREQQLNFTILDSKKERKLPECLLRTEHMFEFADSIQEAKAKKQSDPQSKTIEIIRFYKTLSKEEQMFSESFWSVTDYGISLGMSEAELLPFIADWVVLKTTPFTDENMQTFCEEILIKHRFSEKLHIKLYSGPSNAMILYQDFIPRIMINGMQFRNSKILSPSWNSLEIGIAHELGHMTDPAFKGLNAKQKELWRLMVRASNPEVIENNYDTHSELIYKLETNAWDLAKNFLSNRLFDLMEIEKQICLKSYSDSFSDKKNWLMDRCNEKR
jgi:hypothetical protein